MKRNLIVRELYNSNTIVTLEKNLKAINVLVERQDPSDNVDYQRTLFCEIKIDSSKHDFSDRIFQKIAELFFDYLEAFPSDDGVLGAKVTYYLVDDDNDTNSRLVVFGKILQSREIIDEYKIPALLRYLSMSIDINYEQFLQFCDRFPFITDLNKVFIEGIDAGWPIHSPEKTELCLKLLEYEEKIKQEIQKIAYNSTAEEYNSDSFNRYSYRFIKNYIDYHKIHTINNVGQELLNIRELVLYYNMSEPLNHKLITAAQSKLVESCKSNYSELSKNYGKRQSNIEVEPLYGLFERSDTYGLIEYWKSCYDDIGFVDELIEKILEKFDYVINIHQTKQLFEIFDKPLTHGELDAPMSMYFDIYFPEISA